MTDKTEQIKTVMQIIAEFSHYKYLPDDIGSLSKRIVDALYSPESRVVCPEKQMMICPESATCTKKLTMSGCAGKPHKYDKICCDYAGGCFKCIPVPLPPDELLTEIETLSNAFYNKYSGNGLTPSEVMELHKSEYWESITALILSKVHQSEAAIRADQNKKIATWIQKNDNHFIFHFIPECGGDFCFLATEGMENECAEPDEGAGYCQYRDKCRYANKQLLFGQDFIAKLQKGELEGEK